VTNKTREAASAAKALARIELRARPVPLNASSVPLRRTSERGVYRFVGLLSGGMYGFAALLSPQTHRSERRSGANPPAVGRGSHPEAGLFCRAQGTPLLPP
jgi:hypothetical protein